MRHIYSLSVSRHKVKLSVSVTKTWPWSSHHYCDLEALITTVSPLFVTYRHARIPHWTIELQLFYPNCFWTSIPSYLCVRSPCHLGEVTTASGSPYGRSRQSGSRASVPPPLNLQAHLTRPGSHCKSMHSICFNLLGGFTVLASALSLYFALSFAFHYSFCYKTA